MGSFGNVKVVNRTMCNGSQDAYEYSEKTVQAFMTV